MSLNKRERNLLKFIKKLIYKSERKTLSHYYLTNRINKRDRNRKGLNKKEFPGMNYFQGRELLGKLAAHSNVIGWHKFHDDGQLTTIKRLWTSGTSKI